MPVPFFLQQMQRQEKGVQNATVFAESRSAFGRCEVEMKV
jgi:hypothetical protein